LFKDNKKIHETDHPIGKAIALPARRLAGFAGFILALAPKTEILYFTSPKTAEKASSDLYIHLSEIVGCKWRG
jgi:hypothetical protein